MSPAAQNRIDAAASLLSDRTRGLLCMLGQDDDVGYRRALAVIEHHHPGGSFSSAGFWPVEHSVRILNVVVFCADLRLGPKIDDDGLAALLSFFIQRMAYVDAGVLRGRPQ